MDNPNDVPYQQSEPFYQLLFDAAPDVMVMIDRQGDVRVANSRCQELMGRSPAEMRGTRFQDLLAEWNRPDFEVMLRGIAEGTEMPEVEVGIPAGPNKVVPVMLDVRQVEWEESKHFLVRLRDLREIKSLEQEYRNLFDSIADAVFIGDPESGRIYQANREACELTGYTLGELMGKDYDLVHSEPWDEILKETEQAGGRELAGREMALRTKDGGEVPAEIHLRVIPREDDSVYIETVIDTTVRKALEARMAGLRSEWESFIRHELRTPLTPILAFAQLLLEDYEEVQNHPKLKQYVGAIYSSGKRLETLLDLTREVQEYERGEISLHRLKGDLYRTVRDAIEGVVLDVAGADAEPANRVRLVPHEGDGDPPTLELPHDFQKLQRALANLMKNALEHDEGEVTVRVFDRPEEVSVSVHNWGRPIPEDRLRTIFEKFNTTKRDKKGTGLGTTIAKLFIEAHGGRIEVASSEDEGTTFTATVPKSAPAAGAASDQGE